MALAVTSRRTILRVTRPEVPLRTAGLLDTGFHHRRHASNNTLRNGAEQRYVAKRYASNQRGFDLNPANHNRNQSRRNQESTSPTPVVHQSISLESQTILYHLQQQHADFLERNSLSYLQIHRDGTFALSSRKRGWKIWSHQDVRKKQQWLLVHTAGIFSQYLMPNKSDLQRNRIESKVDIFVRRLERFGK